ncbi:MAG: hypothetical protein LAT78_12250, partial [Roseinatronobacter sp.]|nr:hypothetical protein [Roseinatronobacter sp.]
QDFGFKHEILWQLKENLPVIPYGNHIPDTIADCRALLQSDCRAARNLQQTGRSIARGTACNLPLERNGIPAPHSAGA